MYLFVEVLTVFVHHPFSECSEHFQDYDYELLSVRLLISVSFNYFSEIFFCLVLLIGTHLLILPNSLFLCVR